MFGAVLYDLDGLIVDSEPLHGIASEKALNIYGRTLSEIPESVRSSFYGKRVVDVAEGIVKSLALPVSPERFAGQRQVIFMQLIEQGVGLMPGMEHSLALFERMGLKKSVVSSGDKEYVYRILELTGLAHRFEAVITGNDVTIGTIPAVFFSLTANWGLSRKSAWFSRTRTRVSAPLWLPG